LLKRKSLERHCWTAFTVVTVAGLVIGLGMVWVLRGFSTKVLQTNVIDARAHENYAHGTCLFGVKTNDHTRLDVRLPVGTGSAAPGDGVLFALPEASSFSMHDSTFVASESYTMMNAGTALRGVPVRATLKEFQGFWHGAMGGTLDARLVLDSRTR